MSFSGKIIDASGGRRRCETDRVDNATAAAAAAGGGRYIRSTSLRALARAAVCSCSVLSAAAAAAAAVPVMPTPPHDCPSVRSLIFNVYDNDGGSMRRRRAAAVVGRRPATDHTARLPARPARPPGRPARLSSSFPGPAWPSSRRVRGSVQRRRLLFTPRSSSVRRRPSLRQRLV